jgi:hypothetical protein
MLLAYLGSQCTDCQAAQRMYSFLTSFYIESCIRSVEFSRRIRQTNRIHFCANLGNSATDTLAMLRQVFEEDIMRRTWKVKTHRDRKRRDRWRAKSRACSSFYLTSRWLFIRNTSWQAKQSIPHTTVTSYGDCVNICEIFAPPPPLNFGDKSTGCCITTKHHLTFITRDFFDQQQHDCRPPLTLLFSVSPIEDKTEMPPFDII